MSDKANPDYTNTAEKLTQAPEVKALLDKRKDAIKSLNVLEDEWGAIELANTTFRRMTDLSEIVDNLTKELKSAIDKQGGYQNVEKGEYALKMISYSTTYLIPKIKEHIKDYADKIIIEAVNEKALKGLVKGELVTKEQLALCSEKKKKATTYIIKVI